jgi:4-hydroxybenzoyl-CoA reductase subunit beta
MRLPEFRYIEPETIKEASAFLIDEPGARILAGGTDILPNMKHRVERPSVVVNIKKIPELDFIRKDNGAMRIGALTSLKKIYQNGTVMEKLPALASAASSVGSYHHQNMGTIGGNICQQNRCKYFNQSQWWRSARPLCVKAGGEICHVVNKEEICYSAYSGDVAPALLALNAKILIEGTEGSRELPLETLFSGDGKTPLNFQRGEILTEIIIPEESSEGFSSYSKLANRESIDFPIVGTAFWASSAEKKYRVAFTAVDRKPLRGRAVERFLAGKDLSEKVRDEAVSMASKEAAPVKTSTYSPSYKRDIMGRLLRVAIDEVMRRER